jgi:uncharacterized protein YutE (UPF0331/DUF86 family)
VIIKRVLRPILSALLARGGCWGAAMIDAVLVRKAQTIERCVSRARQEYAAAGAGFNTDFTRQDAAILNIQRACEAALDMAQRVISVQGWGMCDSARGLFAMLQQRDIIDAELSLSLSHMVGFRNITVHDYEVLNIAIVERIISEQLDDVLRFSQSILQQFLK